MERPRRLRRDTFFLHVSYPFPRYWRSILQLVHVKPMGNQGGVRDLQRGVRWLGCRAGP